MKILSMEVAAPFGVKFGNVLDDVKVIAVQYQCEVTFIFNGVTVTVNANSSVRRIFDVYEKIISTSKIIGP